MSTRLPVTCTIIAKDERDRIGLTIRSVAGLVEEVLVIDSGSSDGTQDYCHSLGARVIENAWVGFGPQKRFAEDHARTDWILNLDADEWLSDGLRDEIAALIAHGEPAAKTWRMRLVLIYPHATRPAPFAPYHDYVRLYDRRHARFADSLVHDEVKPLPGSPVFTAPAYHRSFRSLAHLARKEIDYYSLQRAEIRKSPLELKARILVEMPLQFLKVYFGRRHVFGGFYGLQLAMLSAFLRWFRLVILLEK